MRQAAPYRFSLYILVNVVFALLVGLGYGVGGSGNPRLLHVILLFALCSTTIIDLDGLNGRYALLALFMLVYFVSYGVGDFSNLWSDVSDSTFQPSNSSPLSETETLILVGGLMLVLGYRMAVFIADTRRPVRSPRDWSKSAILIVGLIFWVIGTIAVYRWYVYIVRDTTNEATRKGIASLDTVTLNAYLLAQMAQPLGMVLLAYAFRAFRSTFLFVLIITMVLLQVFIGFVMDGKGIAMLGMILLIMTGVLMDGRLPKVWLAVGIMFVTLVYPYFTAYRAEIHGGGVARTTVVEHFGEILKKTIAAKDKVNSGRERAQTFLERSNVKSSVEIIVAKAGNGVDFQHGYTLAPILQAFVPRILWSDKRWIPTGQLFNKAFNITDSDDVFISPSHLGELYWNFGWPGAVVGMGLIGLICGWVGGRCNLAECRTITRVLVTLITIKQLIVGYEGVISDIYVVWLRSLAGIGILHLTFARVPVVSRLFRPENSRPEALHESRAGRLFPNLLT
jgi:O-antigen polysaccharide polymerase Wzy